MTASIADYAGTATAQELLRRFFGWMEERHPLLGTVALEIGGGAGHSTVELARRVGKHGDVVMLEPDPSYLDEARERTTEADLPVQPIFLQGRAQDLNRLMRENGVDGCSLWVWANGIHYLEVEAEVAQFFLDIKKEVGEGYFCTSFWQGSVSMRDFAVLGRMTRLGLEHLGLDYKDPAVPKSRRLHEWSLADYERFAREAGYETVEIVQVPMQLPVDVYQGIAHDVTWVDNALPPEGKLAAFSREERIKALVVGAQKAYEAAGVETTQRIWAFVRVA